MKGVVTSGQTTPIAGALGRATRPQSAGIGVRWPMGAWRVGWFLFAWHRGFSRVSGSKSPSFTPRCFRNVVETWKSGCFRFHLFTWLVVVSYNSTTACFELPGQDSNLE